MEVLTPIPTFCRAKEAARDARKTAGQAFQQQAGQAGSTGQEGTGSGAGASRSAGTEQASTSGRGDGEGVGGKAAPRRTVMGRLKVAFEAVRKEVSSGAPSASSFPARR